MKSLALVLSMSLLAGCTATGSGSTVQPVERTQPNGFAQFLQELAGPGPGLAAHDPRDGTPLFSQIPAWDNAAELRCCSALSRNDFIKARCDTDRPVTPRTNRC